MRCIQWSAKPSLRSALALAFGVSSVALTLALNGLVGQLATAEIQRAVQRDLADVAFQMRFMLDRGMFGRLRDIQVAAALPTMAEPGAPVEARRRILQKLKDTYPHYAWLGFLAPDGTVLASSDGLLEGVSAAPRPIFQEGRKGAYVGDVHDAVVLAKLLPPGPGDTLPRFVDVAAPVHAADGSLIGVLGAHINWRWASDIAETVLASSADKRIDVLVVNKEGLVLLGPPHLQGTLFGLPEDTGPDQAMIVKADDATEHLVAVSVTQGFHAYPGLGWRIVARERLDEALQPVAALQRQIMLGGGLIGLIFVLVGMAMAAIIARPLRRLTAAANEVRLGKTASFDAVDPVTFAEVAALSSALSQSVDALRAKRQSLAAANAALGQTAQDLATLIQSAPLAIVTVDPQGRVDVWNPAAEAMFGYTAEEVRGNVLPVVLPDRAAQFRTSLDAVLNGERLTEITRRYRRKSGDEIDVSLWAAPLRGASATAHSALGIVQDITQEQKLREQLRQSQKMEAIGQLTGGLAHDFNNILGIVLGNLDLLGETLAHDAERMELIDAATNAVLRGSELTRSLLAFSRQQPLTPTPTDIQDLLRGLARLLERGLGERVRLTVSTADGLWPVNVDAVQLETALTNLAVNARDAMPTGGTVHIEARNVALDEDYAATNPDAPIGDCVMIAVTDQGTGMPAAVVARIFEPFFTTKPKDQGTGLGLSMVYGFVKQSGGHVKVYSELGRGTTVRLYLPRHYGAAEERTGVAAGAVPTGTETILVVEDNDAMRAMAVRQLTGLGYHTIEARHGEDALEVVRAASDVALVFSDVVMGAGIDGFELARRIRQVVPAMPILLTSGFPEPASGRVPSTVEGLRVTFLAKPYRRDELARVLRRSLEERSVSCAATAC